MSTRKMRSLVSAALDSAAPDGARWMDQKVTFDNLYVVATTVALEINDDRRFSRFEIENATYLDKAVQREYGKASTQSTNHKNEYDKFVSQQLNMLAFAGVLKSFSGRPRLYSVQNRTLLVELTRTEQSTREFLIEYLQQTLTRWGFWPRFEEYFASGQTDADLQTLKNQFFQLLSSVTGIGTRGSAKPQVESNRIFPKVLNPLAWNFGANGVEGGKVMNAIPSRMDQVYNRPNFRDIATGKPKKFSRKEFEVQNAHRAPQRSQIERNMTAHMKAVGNYHKPEPEVFDHSRNPGVYVHHIFPKSTHPRIKDTKENLILLTAGQHFGQAHKDGNTRGVEPIFQKICLFNKLESVRSSVEKDDGMYSYEGFANVLREGLGTPVKKFDYFGCRVVIEEFQP